MGLKTTNLGRPRCTIMQKQKKWRIPILRLQLSRKHDEKPLGCSCALYEEMEIHADTATGRELHASFQCSMTWHPRMQHVPSNHPIASSENVLMLEIAAMKSWLLPRICWTFLNKSTSSAGEALASSVQHCNPFRDEVSAVGFGEIIPSSQFTNIFKSYPLVMTNMSIENGHL